MATLDSIKAKIQRIIDTANGKTQVPYTDLTSAVNALALGYMNGGSSEYYRYLTFMGADNESVVGTLGVAPVYSCKLADTPFLTKESTVDTVYTHVGWSLEPDGSYASPNLANINADLTLYPVFEASPREYTIRFYDGNTLLRTEKLTYGGSSEYTHKKTGAYFQYWDPAPVNITGDMDCYGVWEWAAFATDTWAQITENSRAGEAAEYYSVGDERDQVFTFENEDGTVRQEHITLKIAAIGFRSMSGGEMAKCITVVAVTPPVDSLMSYHSESSEEMLQYGSNVYNYLNNVVTPAVERVVGQLNLRSITHTVNVAGNYEEIQGGTLPLSVHEVGGNGDYTALEIFKSTDSDTGSATDARDSRVIRLQTGEAVLWWLHDIPMLGLANMVSAAGRVTSGQIKLDEAYVVFQFCV